MVDRIRKDIITPLEKQIFPKNSKEKPVKDRVDEIIRDDYMKDIWDQMPKDMFGHDADGHPLPGVFDPDLPPKGGWPKEGILEFPNYPFDKN